MNGVMTKEAELVLDSACRELLNNQTDADAVLCISMGPDEKRCTGYYVNFRAKDLEQANLLRLRLVSLLTDVILHLVSTPEDEFNERKPQEPAS